MKSNSYGRDYFEKIHKIDNPERKQILKKDLEFLIYKKSGIRKMLDVGCGLGEFLGFCDQRGMMSYGLEISKFALSIAKKNTKAKLGQLDISKEKWPYKSNFFDAVCAFDLLEHVTNSRFVINEVYRVLKKGGIFLVTTPNGDLERNRFLRFLLPYDPTHINVQNENFWQSCFQRVGFRKFQSKGCLFFGFPPHPRIRQRLRIVGVKSYMGPIFFPFKDICATLYIYGYK